MLLETKNQKNTSLNDNKLNWPFWIPLTNYQCLNELYISINDISDKVYEALFIFHAQPISQIMNFQR